jgi:capsular polysaccharide biosynthesis protein
MEKNDLSGFDFENRYAKSLGKWELTNIIITKYLLVRKWYGLEKSTLKGILYTKSHLRKWNFISLASIFMHGIKFWKAGKYYFVFNVWTQGYYHWVTESMLKLALFEDEIKTGTLIIPKGCPSFIMEFLSLAGFKNYREFKGSCFIKKVIYIGNPVGGNPNPDHIQKLRESVFKMIPETKADITKIYISRKKARQRKITNEDELISYLEKEGFYCIDLETISWKEQVILFKNCEMLLSIHGAGLANCVFMKEGGTFIEIFSKQSLEIRSLDPAYKKLSESAGLTHKYHFCDRVAVDSDPNFHKDDLIVDIEALTKAINE